MHEEPTLSTRSASMRTFSDKEAKFIRRLIEFERQRGSDVQALLCSFYFLEQFGRGLIIHTTGNCAVLFLKNEIHDNPVSRDREVREFLEIVSLLRYLCQAGYISIFRYATNDFYLLQDGFDSYRRSGNDIIVNERGFASPDVETIVDPNRNVVYKGVVFRGDIYQSILGTTVGSFFVSTRLQALLSEDARGAAHPTSRPPLRTELSAEEPAQAVHNQKVTDKADEEPIASSETKSRRESKLSFRSVIEKVAASLLVVGLIGSLFYLKQVTIDIQKSIAILQRKITQTGYQTQTKIPAKKRQEPNPEPSPLAMETLHGIDISKWNGDWSHDLRENTDISFVIARATSGETFKDPKFIENLDTAKSLGLIKGAYHFFVVGDDPKKQAENFVDSIKLAGHIDIEPIVDIEEAGLPEHGSSTPDIQLALIQFIEHLKEICGVKPMIYADLTFANEHLNTPYFAQYPLWLAEYSGGENPKLPTNWEDSGFKIWQRRNNYPLNGSVVDFDLFVGRRDQFGGAGDCRSPDNSESD